MVELCTCCNKTHPTLIRVETTAYIHTLIIVYVCIIRVETTTVTCTHPNANV